MPVQRTLFGKPLPQVPPRRLAMLLGALALFAVVTLIFTLPSSIPAGPSLSRFTDHNIHIPKIPKIIPSASILNPFRQAAHAPPVQKNSTSISGDSSWYANWNWLSPFSSSVTLDENRALLPPLMERPPIYTYYDNTLAKGKVLKEAENLILVTWRKAWWAQGFRPVILGPAEAMSNPLYQELQVMDLAPALKTELSRWLAWETMGLGLMSSYLTLPMGFSDSPLLTFLRRGDYPVLTRFEQLGSGLFAGSKASITDAIKKALQNPMLKQAPDFINAVPKDTFEVDPQHDALAVYDRKTVDEKYPSIGSGLEAGNEKDGAAYLVQLAQLMTSHLHSTWQNTFEHGIAVVKPGLNHMSYLVEPALKLAEFLSQCPVSPIPSSCPPNRPLCKPCVASSPMKIATPATFRNTSDLYTIGTVPHPYTMATLSSFKDDFDISWIRRDSSRDPWLTALTKELMGTGVSGAPRVVKFKEAVASRYGLGRSLWLTAEKAVPGDLDWYFGFTIPINETLDNGHSQTPVPGPERRPKPEHDFRDGPVPSDEEFAREQKLLDGAKRFGLDKTLSLPEKRKRDAIEKWNLADTEAWRFARAFLARTRVERLKWEEEEKHFAGAERTKGGAWARWVDVKSNA